MAFDSEHNTIAFSLGGLFFEYDYAKDQANIAKHGISFRTAARVFFDEDYIEALDTSNGKSMEVIRLISARLATSFERGLYYGQYI